MKAKKKMKNAKLRNNEYYAMQELQDYLFQKSQKNTMFYDLIKFVKTQNNLILAYRNIKNNKGSKTCGISKRNLKHLGNTKLKTFENIIISKINNYRPQKIKRVSIPKSNGKIRNLGIQEPEEKIIEQAIYQILNPICMAKFHNNSNGFIECRSQKRAIAQFEKYIVQEKLYFVVDIDIKGFFDNIDHGKLLKQLWSIGIRDKNLLSIISKMLKAEILNVGIPEKGTPQGGILSPLLANIVLNELDWWIESKSKLGIHFVRFADDFKIICPTYKIAKDMLNKTKKWLKERLKLEISAEKTKIVNLKNNYSEFLGFKIKVKKNRGEYIIQSRMNDKAIKNTKLKVKKQIRVIKKVKSNITKLIKELDLYNSQVIGIQNYYNIASKISKDLRHIDYIQNKYITKNLEVVYGYIGRVKNKYQSILKRYGGSKSLYFIRGRPIASIGFVKYNIPYGISSINLYEENSREKIHNELGLKNTFMIERIINNLYPDETLEFNDNIISRFCGQLGCFAITGKLIVDLDEISVIKKNKYNNDNSYKNILIVEKKISSLINENINDDIIELAKTITKLQLEKVNNIRRDKDKALINLPYA